MTDLPGTDFTQAISNALGSLGIKGKLGEAVAAIIFLLLVLCIVVLLFRSFFTEKESSVSNFENSGNYAVNNIGPVNQTIIKTAPPEIDPIATHWSTIATPDGSFQTSLYFTVINPGSNIPKVTFPCLEVENMSIPRWQKAGTKVDAATGDQVNYKQYLITFSTKIKLDTKAPCLKVEF